MKRALICVSLLLLVFTKSTSAQSTIVKLNSIRDADSIAAIQYVYPHFQNGRVFFINKGITPGKLNYSRVNGEILFNNNGQILALNKLETVEKVTIAKDTFLVSPLGGFVKQISVYPAVSLVQASRVRFLDRERKVAFGNHSSISSARGVVTLPGTDNNDLRTKVDENLSFVLTDTYYLLTPSKRLIELNEKDFLLAYPNHKKQLKAYMSNTKIDFNDLEDLNKLLLFAQSLN